MSETLYKPELVAAISEKEGITKVAAGQELDHVVGAIKQALTEHKSVHLREFANFDVVFKEKHEKVNNLNGKTIVIPEKFVIKAKVSKALA